MVVKKRAESQSFSLGEPTEDATYNRDEIPSYEEPVLDSNKKIEPLLLGARKKEIKLSPIKTKNSLENENTDLTPKLSKQKSEDRPFNRKIGLQMFNSFDEKKDSNFEPQMKNNEKSEFALSGGGAMFLKSKKQQTATTPSENRSFVTSPEPTQPRSILRERSYFENSKSLELEKSIGGDKSEKDDDDKKSVRFNLDTTTADITFDCSEKSGSDEENKNQKNESLNDIINVKVTQSKTKTRFVISPVDENSLNKNNNDQIEGNNLKLVKPYPTDFIKPTLKVSTLDASDILHTSESEDDSVLKHLDSKGNLISLIDEQNFLTPNTKDKSIRIIQEQRNKSKSENNLDIDTIKTELWEEKNEEIERYKEDIQKSHNQELERILKAEKLIYEEKIKKELEKLIIEMENRNINVLKQEKEKLENQLENRKTEIANEFKLQEQKLTETLEEQFETKKCEILEKYESKFLELEKELDIKHDLNRTQLITDHNATLEQLKENHTVIIENLKREFSKEVSF